MEKSKRYITIHSNFNRWLKIENVITKEVLPSKSNTISLVNETKLDLGLGTEANSSIRSAHSFKMRSISLKEYVNKDIKKSSRYIITDISKHRLTT